MCALFRSCKSPCSGTTIVLSEAGSVSPLHKERCDVLVELNTPGVVCREMKLLIPSHSRMGMRIGSILTLVESACEHVDSLTKAYPCKVKLAD